MIIILAFLTKHYLQASPPPPHVASSLTPFCPFHSLSCPPGSRVGGLWWRCWVQSEVLLKNGFQNSRYVPSSSLSPSARRWRDVPLEAVFFISGETSTLWVEQLWWRSVRASLISDFWVGLWEWVQWGLEKKSDEWTPGQLESTCVCASWNKSK